ncbi:MAG: hypothetical protein ACRCT1_14515 [Microcoleaceae cyanobacterium]|jgi:predicted nucleic acid-binding protein
MAINYKIDAEIVDIQSDKPQEGDIFLIDTNVWYWHLYPQAIAYSLPYQTTEYPIYLIEAIAAKSLLLYSHLSLAELAHNIEQAERNIFISSSGSINAKEYRHNYPEAHHKVVEQIEYVWNEIKAVAVPVNLTLDDLTADSALTRMQTQPLDGYDLFMLETMQKEGIINIITDDGDFSTVPGIRVFTANRRVIATAQNQDKLLIR